MKFAQILTVASGSLHTALALPPTLPRQQTCTSPKLRKEWSQATAGERSSYIQAVLCLATKPSTLGLPSPATVYDDFSWAHATLNNEIHGVPAFLPWHRYFVHVYEEALHDCGYTGNALYWDWAADSGAPASADVWDPTTGFGGNGNQTTPSQFGTVCVLDGPFTVLNPVYWNNGVRPHCLQRSFAEPSGDPPVEMFGFNFTPDIVAQVSSETVYDRFNNQLENGPHAAVHQGVAGGFRGLGDLGPSSSPNDPIFFLHHTNVDRIWWQWQQQDPQTRTFAYGGTIGENGPTADLDDILPMQGLAPDSAVREYMDVNSAHLCYTY